MAVTFRDVTLCEVRDGGELVNKVAAPLVVQLLDEQENLLLRFRESESSPPITNLSIELYRDSETSRFGSKNYVVMEDSGSPSTLMLKFEREADVIKFAEIIRKFKRGNRESVFAQRTDEVGSSLVSLLLLTDSLVAGVSVSILPVLRISVSAAEHDAGLHSNVDVPASNRLQRQ